MKLDSAPPDDDSDPWVLFYALLGLIFFILLKGV